jgi:AraC-like DNA-binding protein
MREDHFPTSDLLKKYVSYISFSQSVEGKKAFLVFPNPGAAIGLHKHHGFLQEEKNVYRAVNSHHHSQLLHTNRLDPVKVLDEGERESITIVFYPLGISHFLKADLSDVIKNAGGEHSYIDISNYNFAGFADMVFSETSKAKQVDVIENFLLKKLDTRQIELVSEGIELLTDFDNVASIPEICKKIGTSSRNLSRLFNKHIGLTPVEFRNICQFRYSLNKKLQAGKKPLKDIGYESNYSDASYMIRMYKKYTGLNPSAFFDKVTVDSNYVFLSL